MSTNQVTAVSLWQSLRNLLEIELQVQNVEDPDPNTTVTIKVFVTNAAPDSPDWPEIIFKGVNLKVSGRSGIRWNGGQPSIGNLRNGQSVEREFSIRFSEFPSLESSITCAGIDLDRFWTMTKDIKVPTEFSKPTVLGYIQLYNNLNVHKPLDRIAEASFLPTPDTPFSQFQKLLAELGSAAAKAGEIKSSLNDLPFRDLGDRVRQGHIRPTYRYLERVETACGEIKESVQSGDISKISESLNAIEGLKELRSDIDASTRELINRFDITDEEAHFTGVE